MGLQVRTISLSSIHVQNPILSSFFTHMNLLHNKNKTKKVVSNKEKNSDFLYFDIIKCIKHIWNNNNNKIDCMIGNNIPYQCIYYNKENNNDSETENDDLLLQILNK